jgi:hypothetical protein
MRNLFSLVWRPPRLMCHVSFAKGALVDSSWKQSFGDTYNYPLTNVISPSSTVAIQTSTENLTALPEPYERKGPPKGASTLP